MPPGKPISWTGDIFPQDRRIFRSETKEPHSQHLKCPGGSWSIEDHITETRDGKTRGSIRTANWEVNKGHPILVSGRDRGAALLSPLL